MVNCSMTTSLNSLVAPPRCICVSPSSALAAIVNGRMEMDSSSTFSLMKISQLLDDDVKSISCEGCWMVRSVSVSRVSDFGVRLVFSWGWCMCELRVPFFVVVNETKDDYFVFMEYGRNVLLSGWKSESFSYVFYLKSVDTTRAAPPLLLQYSFTKCNFVMGGWRARWRILLIVMIANKYLMFSVIFVSRVMLFHDALSTFESLLFGLWILNQFRIGNLKASF